MGELSGVERDAVQAAEALASLADIVATRGRDVGQCDRVVRALAEEGSVAADRVLAYLRDLRGPGDGVATAYPVHLGPWRDWSPSRGHVFREPQVRVPRRMHGDPGE